MDRFSQEWIDKIFAAQKVAKGWVVPRSVSSVEKSASEELLVKAVKERGFHLVKTETQYLIFCNRGAVNLTIMV